METIITAVFIIDEIDEEAIIESLNEWYYGNVASGSQNGKSLG